MFGMSPPPKQGAQKKVQAIEKILTVSLEDLYFGSDLHFEVERYRLCIKCQGLGGVDASVFQKCEDCKGKGMKKDIREIRDGMVAEVVVQCEACDGRGNKVNEEKRCDECFGKSVKEEKKLLTVKIDKGAPNGQVYTLHGEGDQVPNLEQGDVIVKVREQPHSLYKRKGADLLLEKEVSLFEALTGVEFVITHLDGRKIKVTGEEGSIIKPDDLKTIDGLGILFYRVIVYRHAISQEEFHLWKLVCSIQS